MEVCTADEVLKTMQPGLYTSAIVFLQLFLNTNLKYNPETKVIAPGSLTNGRYCHSIKNMDSITGNRGKRNKGAA
jgi:hypothetical protein